MPHQTDLILTLTGAFAAALALGALTHRLKLSPIVGYVLAGIAVGPYTPGYTAPADPMVQSVLSGMSVEQKLLQLQGVDGGTEQAKDYDDIERSQDDPVAGIRGYMYRDAARGVNLDALQEGRPNDMKNYATVMPTASARGASFDLDLEYRIGEALGDEVRMLSWGYSAVEERVFRFRVA
jgi:hypothetical protein